ncbi:MAG: 50S ribosomal protein L6 [Spirochaetia bacterium]
MSRVGNKEIPLPKGVSVNAAEGLLVVKGAKGELKQPYCQEVSFDIGTDVIKVMRKNESKRARSMHGLYRNLLANMTKGVSDGFTKTLLISGTGYRAEMKGNGLLLNLGYSTQIEYVAPTGVTLACESPTRVNVSGIDKQLVGQAAADIRSIRKPGTYSDKGIRYSDEIVRRKVGKTGVK